MNQPVASFMKEIMNMQFRPYFSKRSCSILYSFFRKLYPEHKIYIGHDYKRLHYFIASYTEKCYSVSEQIREYA